MFEIRRRSAQEILRVLMAGYQAFHLAPELFVAGAHHAQIRGAILFAAFQRSVKDLTNLRPSLRRQGLLR